MEYDLIYMKRINNIIKKIEHTIKESYLKIRNDIKIPLC